MTKDLTELSINKTHLKKGWMFYTLPFDIADESFGVFEPIIKIYRSKLNDNGIKLPTWRSFNFADFKGWHHHIALSEVDEENYMPRFRIMPTGIVKILDRDLTGGTLDTMTQNATREEIQTQIKELMNGPYFGLSKGNMPLTDGTSTFLRSLYLPLTLGGEKVEQFIHAISLGNDKV